MRKKKLHLLALALVPMLTIMVVSTLQEKEEVCEGPRLRVLLLAMASGSDLETSRQIAKPVSDQLIRRVVPGCGFLGAEVVPRNPASNLTPEFKALLPEQTRVADRAPVREELIAQARRYVWAHLLDPLSNATNIGSSPFLAATVAVADEVAAKGYMPKHLVIVFTGDGLVNEQWNGTLLDFGRDQANPAVLSDVSSQLKPLAGACVLLVGLGRASRHDASVLRRARERLAKVFNDAGVRFQATVTKQLPSDCPPAQKAR